MTLNEFFMRFDETQDNIVNVPKQENSVLGQQESYEFVPSMTTIYLDNTKSPISFSRRI